ncbi:MAG: hypothetical protein LBH42_05875, partial [Treponema sp.]|nr:hypothetical protein [Treponema sp.]
MKKFSIFLAALVIILAFGLMFNSCGDGGINGGGSGGNPQTVTYTGESGGATYTPNITENTSRATYSPKANDNFQLTVSGKTSTGAVNSVSGLTFTLKPSNSEITFTATVSVNNLSAMSGTITWSNGTQEGAPAALTPPGGNDGDGSGKTLTVTGIPSQYNGKYGMSNAGNGSTNIIGASTVTIREGNFIGN